MVRPKHPKPDENHRVVVDALEELGIVTCDTSRLRYTTRVRGQNIIALDVSGLANQIDWIIISELHWVLLVEVKQPGKEKNLTEGEQELADTIGILVASNKDVVKYAILERMQE